MNGVQNISTASVCNCGVNANDMKCCLVNSSRYDLEEKISYKKVKQTMLLVCYCFDFQAVTYRHLLLFPSSSSRSCAPAARKPLVKALLAAPSSISYRGPPRSLQGALQTAVLVGKTPWPWLQSDVKRRAIFRKMLLPSAKHKEKPIQC